MFVRWHRLKLLLTVEFHGNNSGSKGLSALILGLSTDECCESQECCLLSERVVDDWDMKPMVRDM